MNDDSFSVDKTQSQSRELELLTMRNVMKTENGRSFMFRCLQNACVNENVFDIDPLTHAYRAGKREQGLWLDRELKEAAPEEYIKMLQEHINE